MPNKTGKGGFKDNPQNKNQAGQRSRAVVATAAQMRELYVKVLHEPLGTEPDPAMSNLEMIVRQHVQQAKKPDGGLAREQLIDRIWGKAAQPITGPDAGPLLIRVVYDKKPASE